jgi:hypothetical protein
MKRKKMEKRKFIIFCIFLCFLCFSCGRKFEKEKWNEREGSYYAHREQMIKDLMENHLKKGMPYKEVIDLLGNDEKYQDTPPNTLVYEVMIDYGWNIDPQKGKTLYIEFTQDSTVKEFRLEKWKH